MLSLSSHQNIFTNSKSSHIQHQQTGWDNPFIKKIVRHSTLAKKSVTCTGLQVPCSCVIHCLNANPYQEFLSSSDFTSHFLHTFSNFASTQGSKEYLRFNTYIWQQAGQGYHYQSKPKHRRWIHLRRRKRKKYLGIKFQKCCFITMCLPIKITKYIQ